MVNMMYALPNLMCWGMIESANSVLIDLVSDECVERSADKCFDILKYVQAGSLGYKQMLMSGRKYGKFVQEEFLGGAT
jgi:hypothetical protein